MALVDRGGKESGEIESLTLFSFHNTSWGTAALQYRCTSAPKVNAPDSADGNPLAVQAA